MPLTAAERSLSLAIKQLPHVTIIGEHTNGIFSYRTRDAPQWLGVLFVVSGVLFGLHGVLRRPRRSQDIELLNTKANIENDIDPLITLALRVLKSKNAGAMRDDSIARAYQTNERQELQHRG